MPALASQNFIRVAAVALGLSTLSFAAGVAGDLTIIDPPRSGQSVVLRIPPELPADAIRAAPLPPLLSTASAEASPAPRARPHVAALDAIEWAHEPEQAVETALIAAMEPSQKPYRDLVLASAKPRAEDAPMAYAAKPA
jgi:hypothetical protein